ncbi:MAG: hydrogenase maturation protease [Egibacteraceae bacterium]
MSGVVVIGYGNDLRGDDGAGRRVAEAVAAAGLPGVTVRSVHQLAPEHAADVAGRRCAIFVDARLAGAGAQAGVTVQAVSARVGDAGLTHHTSPAALLALAATLGPPPGDAFVVSIPAGDLGIGTTLSTATAAAVDAAVDQVVALCACRP